MGQAPLLFLGKGGKSLRFSKHGKGPIISVRFSLPVAQEDRFPIRIPGMEESKTPQRVKEPGPATPAADDPGRPLPSAGDQAKSILADIAFYLTTAGSALAGSFTYQMEARFQDGAGVDQAALRKRAITRIHGLLLDEFCDYLEREPAVRRLRLTRDQIRVLSEQFLEKEILEEKFEGDHYYLKARLVADPARYADSSAAQRQLEGKANELDAAKRKVDAALADVKRLEGEVRFARMKQHVVDALALEPPSEAPTSVDEGLEGPPADLGVLPEEAPASLKAKAVDLAPPDAGSYLQSGATRYLAGQYEAAIQDFTRAIDLDARNARAFNARGSAFAALERYDEALEDFSRAVAQGGDLAEAYFNRGVLFLVHKNDPEKAVNDLGRAIELAPEDFAAVLCRGVAYERLGRHAESVSDFTRAAEGAETDAAPVYNRANVYLRSGDMRRAIADYSEALRRNPRHAGALFNRAFGYARQGEFEKALRDFNQVITIGPADPKAFLYRGHVHYRLGRTRDARADWEMAAASGEEAAIHLLAEVRA